MMNIIQSERQRRHVKCESMKFSMVCIVLLMLMCQVQCIRAYERHHYEYYYPENDYIEQPNGSDGNGLADYWKVFKETFQKSYKDLNKPYVIEREVPVYVPVYRDRTVVKHHPVVKPNRIFYRRRPQHYKKY